MQLISYFSILINQKGYSLGITVLDFSGCYNKMPWIEWLKQQEFTSHSSGGWEDQDQGASDGVLQ